MNALTRTADTILDARSKTLEHSTTKSYQPAIEEILKQWRLDPGHLDAAQILCDHPEWANNKSAVLDLAFEEYCLRAERGSPPQIEEFAKRFGPYETSLLHLLEVQQCLSGLGAAGTLQTTWPSPGQRFMGFTLLEELGRGGFARVFLAQEEALSGRLVVVKLSALGFHEAEIMARLQHSNIVPVYSVLADEVSGLTLICMPFLGRGTLYDVLRLIKERSLPKNASALWDIIRTDEDVTPPRTQNQVNFKGSYTEAIVRLLTEVAQALAHAHAAKICHGDLKPSNVLLSSDGHARLLDFNLSSTGAADFRLGGTLPYMAPEQLPFFAGTADEEPICTTPQSDLFSFGVVLYELLTGHEPFGPLPQVTGREELCSALLDQRRQQPLTPRALNPTIDGDLERIVLACLSFSPEERPRCAALVAGALNGYMRPRKRAARWLVKSRNGVAAAGLLLGVGLTSAGYLLATRDPYAVRQLREAREYYVNGQYKQARDYAQRAIDADEKLADAMFLQGRSRQKMGALEAAFEDYQFAYERTSQPILLAAQGYCSSRTGRHKEAIAIYRLAIQENCSSAEVWNDLGYSYSQLRQFEEALRCLSSAIESNRYLSAAYHNRAVVGLLIALASNGIPSDQALSDIELAIQYGSPSAELFQDAALLYSMTAEPSSSHRVIAERYLRRAIEYGLPKSLWKSNPQLSSLISTSEELISVRQNVPSATRLLDPIPDGMLSLQSSAGAVR